MLSIGIALIVLLCGLLVLFLREDRRRASAQAAVGMVMGFWRGAERRCSVRLRLPASVRYRILTPYGNGNEDREAVSVNVSEGGLCLRMYERLTPPMMVQFEILLPDAAEPIRGTGEVRWAQEERSTDARRMFLTGIQFSYVSLEERDRLIQMLKGARTAART